jgi:predicted acyltransferase (DUF342 family)
MLALPLAPAVTELIRRRDAGPLATRKDDGHIGNFAAAFRRYVASLQPSLAACTARNSIVQAQLRDGQWATLVGVAGYCGEIDPNLTTAALFSRAVWLSDGQVFTKDVYAADVLHGGKRNIFRALLGEKDIFLGEETQVLRWIHAEGKVIAAADSSLFGRFSAGEAICLSQGCRFERAHAPAIFAMINAEIPSPSGHSAPVEDRKRPRKAPEKLGRSRIDGDLHLRVREMFLGNIVATGSIQVEQDTQIVGSAKAHGDIHLHDRAQIKGAVVSTASVHTGSNCFIQGPVLAESDVYVGVGTRIGTPDSPTTVSAPRIHLAPGCVIHGTAWARVEGRVEG